MPMDLKAAGPGFVDDVQHSVRRAQRAHDFVERREIRGDHPVMPDLALPAALGHRDVDRFLVDI